jgi:hypothetical protein
MNSQDCSCAAAETAGVAEWKVPGSRMEDWQRGKTSNKSPALDGMENTIKSDSPTLLERL